jgi:hypothetical protein
MHRAIAKLESTSPYSQSKHYDTVEVPELPKELKAAYEERTWRHRMHTADEDAALPFEERRVAIPGMCFSNSLKEAAKRLKIKVAGKGRVEWTKYFEAGVMSIDSIVLSTKVKDVPGQRLFVPSDGKRGGGSRVTKIFPLISEWKGEMRYEIFDDMIVEDVFKQFLTASGILVGVGRFRPERSGYYGRFSVKAFKWQEIDVADMAAE